MTAEPITSPTPWAEQELGAPIFGVYDRDLEDFVFASLSLRDVQDRETDIEQGTYLAGGHIGGYIGNTWVPRYSIDQIPADHELAEQVRL